MIEYCLCDHEKFSHHFYNPFGDEGYEACAECQGECEFNLDNLRLIEDLAKEKNLI